MYITLAEANAWLESTKLTLSTLDAPLLDQVSTRVLGALAGAFDTTGWTNESNTPQLVRSIIAMHYVAWVYSRAYSDDSNEDNDYSALLRRQADISIAGLVQGSITLPEVPVDVVGQPAFFPNDLSSSQQPTTENPSDGAPAFMMGTTF
jgi:hypothetical protein